MANQKLLDILKQGVEVWNQWRKEHPEIHLELSRADLRDIDLSGVYLSKARLRGADLSRAHLSKANFSKAYLSGAVLSGAVLSGAVLSGAVLSGANLTEAVLSGTHLTGADLSKAVLSGADFTGAHLYLANLTKAVFTEAVLTGANLSKAVLSATNLTGADLTGADLTGADLSATNLTGTELSHAHVGRTTFGDIDLRSVKGLDTIKHEGPSTIGIDTILRSEGNIPEAFLRGTGASDTFIDYVRSLAQKPIEYYTCFISYSSKDTDFAERLYTDLQHQGIRCWFAPEDLKIGDKIRTRIDESIRLHDKLLVILSQHSIESTWVEKEVETAFAREARERKLVLFPVRLDDTVKESKQAWAADIQTMRHIGDFSQWKDHEEYQKAFIRLLRDLQASASTISQPQMHM